MIEINSMAELDERIQGGVSVIFFNAPWLAPCHLQEPILETIAGRFEGKAHVATVNIDLHQEFALRLRINKIPTLIIYKNRKEIQRLTGLQSEATLRDALATLLDGDE